jgi:hypothetical protein
MRRERIADRRGRPGSFSTRAIRSARSYAARTFDYENAVVPSSHRKWPHLRCRRSGFLLEDRFVGEYSIERKLAGAQAGPAHPSSDKPAIEFWQRRSFGVFIRVATGQLAL